jgi:hypothetical protein
VRSATASSSSLSTNTGPMGPIFSATVCKMSSRGWHEG